MNHDENTDLGTCCVCQLPGATVIHMLNAQAPIAGHGWGCAQCGIGPHGALAVVCERCAATAEASATPAGRLEDMLRYVCRGFPGTEGRVPIEDLRGEHGHDREKHPQVPQIQAMTILASDTRFGNHAEEGQGCHCSRCGQTIWDGSIAIRCFPKSGEWQYRYHPTCFGAIPIYENAYEARDDWDGDEPLTIDLDPAVLALTLREQGKAT